RFALRIDFESARDADVEGNAARRLVEIRDGILALQGAARARAGGPIAEGPAIQSACDQPVRSLQSAAAGETVQHRRACARDGCVAAMQSPSRLEQPRRNTRAATGARADREPGCSHLDPEVVVDRFMIYDLRVMIGRGLVTLFQIINHESSITN